ncbi:MAG: 2-hydroxyacid dehydrogenase [Desulfurococcales archaeon]|nr:2-hydroxyacid dehydrogenase [Desulfurococcales archaeon]
MKVLTTHTLPKEARELLEREANLLDAQGSREKVQELIGEAEVLIAGFMKIDSSLLAQAQRLRLIVSRSSGVDHIDVGEAERRGICVANQPEAIAEAVSEHVVGLVIASLRRIVEGHNYTVSGGWASERGFLRGVTVRGKTIGVLGMGRIGVLVAWKLRALGAGRILYYSRRRKREVEQLLHAEPASLKRIFRESDVIIAALPHTRETTGLIDYELLSTMKKGALLVNVGRGSLIDPEDLARIIEERSDLRVALDVHPEEPLPPDHPLARLASTGRIVLTPHHAGGTDRSLKETAILAARQVLHYIETGTVWNPVNSVCREARDISGLWSPLEE